VLGRLESGADGPPRQRRAASARLDLALALTTGAELDEAASTTLEAVTSGLLVPSNYWRADEVITVIDRRGLPEAGELQEAYREYCSDTDRRCVVSPPNAHGYACWTRCPPAFRRRSRTICSCALTRYSAC